MMYDSLIKFIRQHAAAALTEDDIALIKEQFVYRKLRKRQFLLQEGDVCKYLGFVIKGALRQYTVDDKGMEHIVGLHIENWWTGDRESYFNNSASIYNIEAWEETDLLLLPKSGLDPMNSIYSFLQMRIKLDENYAVATQKRLLLSISSTAENRYEELLKDYPEFLQRFPQHIIASYLGITKETLSRIRNQAVKNKSL